MIWGFGGWWGGGCCAYRATIQNTAVTQNLITGRVGEAVRKVEPPWTGGQHHPSPHLPAPPGSLLHRRLLLVGRVRYLPGRAPPIPLSPLLRSQQNSHSNATDDTKVPSVLVVYSLFFLNWGNFLLIIRSGVLSYTLIYIKYIKDDEILIKLRRDVIFPSLTIIYWSMSSKEPGSIAN